MCTIAPITNIDEAFDIVNSKILTEREHVS